MDRQTAFQLYTVDLQKVGIQLLLIISWQTLCVYLYKNLVPYFVIFWNASGFLQSLKF